MNEFIGKIDSYKYLDHVKLTGIKYVEKDEYAYFFYTFIDNNGNTIIAKEKKELYWSFIKYTCSITGRIINGMQSKEWDELVRIEIQNGKLLSINQQYKLTFEEKQRLYSMTFSGNQRINHYNPKTMEFFCLTGESGKRILEIGDEVIATSTIKKHTEFKGIKQTIVNIDTIKEVLWKK